MKHDMAQPPRKRGIQVLPLLLIPVIFLVAVIWFVTMLTNRDPEWFHQEFTERPVQIRIYHYGSVIDLKQGDPGFDELVAAVNAEIPQHKGYYETLHPRGDTLAHYKERGYAIALIYDKPVQVHTRNFFPEAPNLMIALDGSYNYTKYALLFRGKNEEWLPGGLALVSTEQIETAAEQVINSN